MLAGKQVFVTRTPAPTPAPTLTADDVTRLRTAIGMLARSLRYTDAGAGLTPSELTVLSTIARSGPIGLSELGAQQRLNPTMLSRIAGKLCEAGLIERTAAPDDRRAAVVDVTAAGRRRHRAIQAERTASLTRHVEALAPAEAAALIAALPALEALGAECAGGPPMTMARRLGTRTFAALAIPNYRRYFAGQAVSLVGTWMQTIAMGWLLLTLTGSGALLGALIAVQTLARAGARAVRRRRRRPGRQAAADDGGAGGARRRRARARRAHRHRRGAGLAGVRAGRSARAAVGVRQPDAAVVRARDGRARRPPERGHAQLRAGERRAGGRARPSPASSSPPSACRSASW